MKILTVTQKREADQFTIEREPVKSIDLMERAAFACAEYIKRNFSKRHSFYIFCGNGNNGGDGLAIARILIEDGYNCETFIVNLSSKASEDFQINLDRFKKSSATITELNESISLPLIKKNSIVIDSLLGSGINKPVEGFLKKIVEFINEQKPFVISIDAPTGFLFEKNKSKSAVVKASLTFCFETPYLEYLFPESERFIGDLVILPIGLHPDYFHTVSVKEKFVDLNMVQQIIKKRSRFSHKGTFGHALVITGSKGKAGAALLSSKAALRSGCGLVTAHVPSLLSDVIHLGCPEAMVDTDPLTDFNSEVKKLDPYSSIGIGPGIGLEKETQNLLKNLIQNTHIPLVLDADALNILAENKTWLSFLPSGSILTPHVKEFERLTGKCESGTERFQKAKELSFKHNCYIVLKGAYTTIVGPDGKSFFNSTGNPGMATGGSGDVLTGIVTGLMAQGYCSQEACILGVYVHGLAGDIAAKKNSEEALIAGDIIENLGLAFVKINGIDESC